MMKHKLILFILFFANSPALPAKDRVAFKLYFSEIYATYDFITKIADSYPDNDLKTIYTRSKYNTESYKQQLAAFENIRLNYTYTYDQYPLPLKVAMMSADLLEKNLATSQTVQEFKNKSVGIIPNEDLIRFSDILKAFQPVYHELIARPNAAALAVQKNNLLAYINNNCFADYFQVGLLFYHTEWDKSIPFELNLLPSPEKGNLGARAFFNMAVCEASLNLKDHKTFFSVAMHEIYHIIYDNQSREMKKNIQQWFDQTNSANSQYALLLLNEVLATSLGNAYIMERLNGKIAAEDWYGNKYITEISKAVYPLVKDYINNKKSIDEDFVKAYVHLYDILFPNWNHELMHLFMYRYLVADNRDDLSYFRKTFRYYSNNRTSSNISVSEIEKAKDNPLTKVFIISTDHAQKLTLLKQSFAALEEIKMDAQQEFIEVVTLEDRTKLFIINRHQSTVADLMKKYFPDNIIK